MADEVDTTEQIEGGITRYIVRNRVSARYFILKRPEYLIFSRINGERPLPEIAQGAGQGPRVSHQALKPFLTKLDSLGLLARGGSKTASAAKGEGLYARVQLFNPNRLLTWLDGRIGWALTKPVIAASFVFILVVALGLIARVEEAALYTGYTYAEYGLAVILMMTLIITVLHEFAHGLACKHFGGEVRDMGVLMIYYVLPAFYCNVTDIYRIGRKRERLWVICAGIYWQLLVSAAGAAFWMVATPYTAAADFAFLVFAGGTLNILLNCNPLIKLDGYYALAQLMGIPNLQARAAGYVGSVFARVAGEPRQPVTEGGPRAFYLIYWLCSIIYSAALTWLILGWVGHNLMDLLGFTGVLLTMLLALLMTKRWWKPAIKGVFNMSAQPALQQNGVEQKDVGPAVSPKRAPRRKQVIKWSVAVLLVAALVAPWEASTGSDCALVLPPGREDVARANTDAVLKEIYVRQGDAIAQGAKLARLANPDIEDRLAQLNAEIVRLDTNSSKIEEELRVRSEMLLSANFTEAERKRLANELKSESTGIAASQLPASLAILQSEIELKQTELEHNKREVERYKKLLDQQLIGAQQYDSAVAAQRITEKELQGARARLEAAMVEHRRMTSGAQTSSLVAETEARAARSNFEALIAELHANRQQIEALRQRRDILQREYEGMNLQAPRAGVVLGEDLHKSVGRRYHRGEEICRIGELNSFLLRIDVSEREIAEVRLDSPVRFKLKTLPGRTFTGAVSKINAEPVLSHNGQRLYPVEVLVENGDGVLRPGMTGFARISFGRRSVGLIIAERVWQTLRPELWLF